MLIRDSGFKISIKNIQILEIKLGFMCILPQQTLSRHKLLYKPVSQLAFAYTLDEMFDMP